MIVPPHTLIIEAATRRTHVGWVDSGGVAHWHVGETGSLAEIFIGTRQVLRSAGQDFADVEGFLFGAGPGSLLGLRVAAMAIETWRQGPDHKHRWVRSYGSLEAAAWCAWRFGLPLPVRLVAEHRKEWWHLVEIERADSATSLRLIGSQELADCAGPLHRLDIRPRESPAPRPLDRLVPDFTPFQQIVERLDCRIEEGPLPIYPETSPEYVRWSGLRHGRTATGAAAGEIQTP